MDQDTISYSFSNGITGVAWTIQHLKSEGLVEADDSIFSEFDDFIFSKGIADTRLGVYDYLHNDWALQSIFLSRQNSESYHNEFLLALQETSKLDSSGQYWLDPFYELQSNDNRPSVNLAWRMECRV